MGRGFRKFYTSVVTIGLAGVLAIGAYKWDNLKPALTTTSQIYTESDLQAREESVQKDYENQIAESNAKVEELETQVEELQAEKVDLTTQVNSLTSEKTQLQTQVDSLSVDKENLQNEVDTLTTEKLQLESDIISKQTRITELETNITSLNSQISEKDTKIEELETEVETLKSQSGDNSEVESLEAEIETLKTEKANLQTQVDSLTSEKTQLQEDITAKETRISELETEVSEKATSIQQLETEVSEKQTRITELETQVSEKNTRISELEAQVEELENATAEPVLALFNNEEEILEGQALISGDTPSEPETVPTKEGYNFMGWSLDKINVVNLSETPITENTTFYAVFAKSTMYAGLTLQELIDGGYVTLTEGALAATTTFSELGSDDLIVPAEVTSIAASGFLRAPINNLDLSNSNVQIIGPNAFEWCTIHSVKWSPNLIEISDSAFSNGFYALDITEMIIPESVVSIGEKAFYSALTYCNKLVISSTVQSIGKQAFSKIGTAATGQTSIYIPSSVTTITASSANYGPFSQADVDGCIIYTGIEESAIPSGWGTYWKYSKSGSVLTVNYGYTYEEFLTAIGE